MDSRPPHSPRRSSRRDRFPEVVRLRHFIILPTLAMGAVIAISRIAGAAVLNQLDPEAAEIFRVVRTIAIALVMTSLIGWLAIRYRRRYEIELRERNKELEETRDFLSSIIRDSAEGIVTLDTEDRITSWNRAAERIFGWAADEVTGQGVARLLPNDRTIVDERRRVAERLRAGETVRDHETRRLRKDGKPVSVRISWSPLHDAGGRHAGAIGIVLDVTAQKDMQERLVERERLAAVGEMAAHVAHEIRNPLAGIRAACEVLFTRNEAGSDPQEIGQEVVHQIDRLNQTVTELLQFAVPRKLEFTPTDLNALIERIGSIFCEDPQSRKVAVEFAAKASLPTVNIDAGQFEQVFYNLLLNAAQAMNHEGTVVVSAALAGEQIEIRIRDTGPGLPEGVGEKLFAPFFTTRTEGSGLGLAIVRKIVLAHGGTIEASNHPNGGAEFLIRLPAAGTR